jgi:hypothetical protein
MRIARANTASSAAMAMRLPGKFFRQYAHYLCFNLPAGGNHVLAHGFFQRPRRYPAMLGKLERGNPDIRI